MRPGTRAKRAGRKVTAGLRAQISRGLAAARKARGLTQADIATSLGMATEVYGRMERGQLLPSLPTFLLICAHLEVGVEQILGSGTEFQPARGKHALQALAVCLQDSSDMRYLFRMLVHARPRQVRLLRLVVSGLVNPTGKHLQ